MLHSGEEGKGTSAAERTGEADGGAVAAPLGGPGHHRPQPRVLQGGTAPARGTRTAA